MSQPTIQISAGGGAAPQYVVRSQTNGRENNEDSFLIFTLSPGAGPSPIYLLAIADGMGGHAHGEHISRETLRKVSLSLFEQVCVEPSLNHPGARQPVAPDVMAAALWVALQQVNHHVRRMIENNRWDKAGSTLVLAAILEHRLVAANLGDSPLFHYRPDKRRLTKITEDHTVAGALLRANMITPDMAQHHEGRSRLHYYLGCEELPHEAPVRRLDLRPGDLLLLCSDGVSGSLTNGQIDQILADPSGNLAQMADRLLQAALAAGETDNQTLILWRHTGPDQSPKTAMPTLVVEASGQGPTPLPPFFKKGAD